MILNQKIEKYRRQIIVALILVFLIVFHRNYSDESRGYIESSAIIQRHDTFEVKSCVGNNCVLSNAVSTEAGESYRLIVKVRLVANKIKDNFSGKNVDIYVITKSGDERMLGSMKIDLLNFDYAKEIVFDSDDYYTDLRFNYKKDNEKEDFSVRGKVLSFSKLKTGDSLNPTTLAGYQNVRLDEIGSDSRRWIRPDHDVPLMQKFLAKSDSIVYVDVNIKKIGDGGQGVICLNLFESQSPDPTGGPGKRFSTNCIDTRVLDGYQINKSYYRLPLVSWLSLGSDYFISMSFSSLRSNRLNTIEIFGEYGKNIHVNSTPVRLLDSGFSPVYYSGVAVPGTIIEDIGGNNIYYQYKPTDSYLDLLSVDKDTNDLSEITYDPNLNAIVSNSRITMKFKLGHRIDSLTIRANMPNDNNINADLFYSLSNGQWVPIPPDNPVSVNDFLAKIFNNQSDEIMIKVSKPEAGWQKTGVANLDIRGKLYD